MIKISCCRNVTSTVCEAGWQKNGGSVLCICMFEDQMTMGLCLGFITPLLSSPLSYSLFTSSPLLLSCPLSTCSPLLSAPGCGPKFRSTTVAVEPVSQAGQDLQLNWADMYTRNVPVDAGDNTLASILCKERHIVLFLHL